MSGNTRRSYSTSAGGSSVRPYFPSRFRQYPTYWGTTRVPRTTYRTYSRPTTPNTYSRTESRYRRPREENSTDQSKEQSPPPRTLVRRTRFRTPFIQRTKQGLTVTLTWSDEWDLDDSDVGPILDMFLDEFFEVGQENLDSEEEEEDGTNLK